MNQERYKGTHNTITTAIFKAERARGESQPNADYATHEANPMNQEVVIEEWEYLKH